MCGGLLKRSRPERFDAQQSLSASRTYLTLIAASLTASKKCRCSGSTAAETCSPAAGRTSLSVRAMKTLIPRLQINVRLRPQPLDGLDRRRNGN